MTNSDSKTHFGYREVDTNEKESLVGQVFDAVAGNYDLMNDAMSMGVHRAWKWFTVAQSGVGAGDVVLDLASGSGDLAIKFADKVGPQGKVFVTDINDSMLAEGRKRLTDAGVVGNVEYQLVNAEQLPFDEACFDVISISFGLRNVTHKQTALREMVRCLKPGGRALILEF